MAGEDYGMLRRQAALTPDEQAQENLREASPANVRMLDQAISGEKDPARREILEQVRRRLDAAGAMSAPAAAPAAAPESGINSFLRQKVGQPDGGARGAVSLDDFLRNRPEPTPAPPPSSGLRRLVGDTGVALLHGAIDIPEGIVGLGDIVTGGHLGKALENEGGAIGFRPKQAHEFIDQNLLSPEQQQANEAVGKADGVLDTLAEVYHHPSVAWQSAVRSLPSMFAGSIMGKAVMAGAERIAPVAIKAMGAGADVAAGAIGEGVTGAGQAAEQIRQETPGGTLTGGQAGLAVASGIGDTAFAMLGGRVAKKLGIHDVDTMLAGKGSPEVTKTFLRSMLEGAASEGLLEELPQSIQEQVLQNMALGKPLGEGVEQQAVLGAITGGMMGAGGNVLHRGGHAAPTPANQVREQKIAEPNGPMSKAVNASLEAQAKAVEIATEEPTVATTPASPGVPEAPVAPPAAVPETPPAVAEPATAVAPPSDAVTPPDALPNMHAAAAAEAQGLRDFRPGEAPPAQGPASITMDESGVNALLKNAADRENAPSTNPDDIRQALDDLAQQHHQIGRMYGTSVLDDNAHQSAESPHNDLPEPTNAQAKAGNYTMGHDRETFPGLDLTIENPAGSIRKDRHNTPPKWQNEIQDHYGYVKGTEGADGDHVDVFVKPGTPVGHAGPAFVVDQVDPKTGAFDEHKAMLGYASEAEARAAYLRNYSKGWKGLGAITPMTHQEFVAWAKDKAATVKPAADAFPERAPVSQPDQPATQTSAPAERTLADTQAAHDAWRGLSGQQRRDWMARVGFDGIRPWVGGWEGLSEKSKAKLAADLNEQPSVESPADPAAQWAAATPEQREQHLLAAGWKKGSPGTAAMREKDWAGMNPNQRARISKAMEPSAKTPSASREVAEQQRLFVISADGKKFPVADMAEAAAKWEKFREAAGEGVSKLGNGVRVVDQHDKFVGRVSYNGRIWDTEDEPLSPAPAAPASAAATTGEDHGQGQEGQGRRQERLLTPQAPTEPREVQPPPAPAPAPQPAPEPAAQPVEPSREVIELRKRHAVLESLKACLGA